MQVKFVMDTDTAVDELMDKVITESKDPLHVAVIRQKVLDLVSRVETERRRTDLQTVELALEILKQYGSNNLTVEERLGHKKALLELYGSLSVPSGAVQGLLAIYQKEE